jgi:hypothetical protein
MGGKVVFIVHHGPHFARPVKRVVSIAFDAFEPFAKDPWFNEVAVHGCWSKEFAWSKQ